ncbi:MAG TPA: cytochrome P450 [Streptosporangiaceae bacterium]|nr:cytochrome P450 [Streptosporangiaceae bacterium]
MRGRQHGAELDAHVKRPNQLDRSFDYFHRDGTEMAWWSRDGGYWFVAGYDLVDRFARDHASFSSRHDFPTGATPYLGVMLPPSPIAAAPLELDPPQHTVLRSIMRSRFSSVSIRKLNPRIEQLTDRCLDRHIGAGRLDIYHDLIQMVCSTMVLELVGMPLELAAVLADAAQVEPTMSRKAEIAWGRLIEALVTAVEESRRAPGDNLMGDLCRSSADFITDKCIMEIAATLLLGGSTSPVKLLLDTFTYLGSHPSDRLLLARDKKLRRTAVEELLRVFSPTEIIARTATRDVAVGGEMIKAGDRVVLGFGAANRDSRVFACPNDMKFDRKPNPHLAMGRGIHHCLGAALGRAEAATILDRTLARIPDFRLVSDTDNSRPRMDSLIIEF